MKTFLRRMALVLGIMIAVTACTPAQMADWLEDHHRPVPTDHDELEAQAGWATALWQHMLEVWAYQAEHGPFGWPWDQLSQCEAGGNWHINTGNGYYGGLQFAHSTWVAFGGQAYSAYAHQAAPRQQIAIAKKVVAANGGTYRAWPGCRAHLGLP
jgi:Transglycosylase-like domain